MAEGPRERECPECYDFGTIMMRGIGRDTQFKVCPFWREPGHLEEHEIRAALERIRRALNPSGRTA